MAYLWIVRSKTVWRKHISKKILFLYSNVHIKDALWFAVSSLICIGIYA
jgi:hypothetical protein